MAVCGRVRYFFLSPWSRLTLANMPGSSWRLALGTVASTCTLRVAASTLGLIEVTLPGKATPGQASALRLSFWPTDRPASCFCGTKKST